MRDILKSVVHGVVTGLVAGLVLVLMGHGPVTIKEEQAAVVSVPETPREVVPGMLKEKSPELDALAGRLMEQASVDELKKAYKDCNRTLMEGKLGHGGIQMCGAVYETLKEKGFDGDYMKFYAWSKTWK